MRLGHTSTQRCSQRLELEPTRPIAICRHDNNRRRIGPVVVHDALGRVVEERLERVMVFLRDRIELVVVARGAADGQSQEHRARGVRAILDVLKAHFFFDDAVLIGRRVVSDEAGCDALIERRIRQKVARELLDGKSIEWLVAVERPDYPVAIRPDAAAIVVVVKAVGVAVTRRIEPIPRAVLAVLRRGQQPVDHLRVRIGGRIGDERRHVFRARGQARQVQRHAPDQRAAIGFGIRRESGRFHLREDKSIDGRARPLPIGDGRQVWTHGRDKCPVLLPFRALLDPAPERFLLRVAQRLVTVLRRHPPRRARFRDPLVEQALTGLARHDWRAARSRRQRVSVQVESQVSLARGGVGTVAQETVVERIGRTSR